MTYSINGVDGIEVHRIVATTAVEMKSAPIEQVIIVDVSGSMYGSLPVLRQHLKKLLRGSVRVGNLVTIVWFSSQSGIVCERYDVRNAEHIRDIERLIDANLYSRGTTSFVPPLNLVRNILSAPADGYATSLMFMSDGADNHNTRPAIYEACDGLAVDSSVVVEYGWYADRATLTKMAEILGAEYVFSEDMDEFVPIFDKMLTHNIMRTPDIKVGSSAEFLYSPSLRRTFTVSEGAASIPENADYVLGVTRGKLGDTLPPALGLVALAGAYAQRMNANTTFDILGKLGDVRLYKQFSNCFSKQDYVNFGNAIVEILDNPDNLYVEGKSDKLVLDSNATCVMDVLAVLSEGGNKLAIQDMKYRRIGRKSVAGVEANREDIDDLREQLRGANSPERIAEISGKLAAIADVSHVLEFKSETDLVDLGDLVFNQSRPNVSLRTLVRGWVSIPADKQTEYGLPGRVETSRWRSYALIADGIVNVSELPVQLCKESFEKLKALGVVDGEYDESRLYEIALAGLPVINRSMTLSINSQDYLKEQVRLARLEAENKVYKWFLDKARGGSDAHRYAGFTEKYGEAAAEWLKSHGVTDSGFNPRVVSAPAEDEVVVREVKNAIKGMSSYAKVEEVIELISKNASKIPAKALFMIDAVKHAQTIADNEAELSGIVATKTKEMRDVSRALSIVSFVIAVGHVWFNDCDSLDPVSREAEPGVLASVELVEKTIKI